MTGKHAKKGAKTKGAKGEPVQLRLEPDLEKQIDEIVGATGLKKVEIIRRCARLGAAVIIKDGFRLPPINPIDPPKSKSDEFGFATERAGPYRGRNEPTPGEAQK